MSADDVPRYEKGMDSINIAGKLASLEEHWSPKLSAEVNGQGINAVKAQGEFVWHHHEDADEFFLVIRGTLRVPYRDADGAISESIARAGEFIVVPRGVEHCPVADEEVEILLIEPADLLNTGNVRDAKTVDRVERI